MEKLFENVYVIDCHDLKMEERTGSYILTENDLTLIETSASPSVPYIKEGLQQLGYSLSDVRYIIVTHIHLDHAGGAGLLLEQCPHATVIVHPKGKRHLNDPSRLIAGAKQVYGDKFSSLFDPIIPISEERLQTMDDKETLTIGKDCTLTFFDSPGHANHHFSIYYPKVNGIFSGDTLGIRYPSLLKDGVELYLPSTSPNQFNPEKMLDFIQKCKDLNIEHIFFGHFGVSSNPNEVYKQITYWVEEFVQSGKKGFTEGKDFVEQVNITNEDLLYKVTNQLKEKGMNSHHPVFEIIKMDIEVSAMGLIDYFHKQNS